MEAALVLLQSFVIYISNKAATLQGLSLDATVEAEYGNECVEGRLATLAHHGPRSNNPPPCDNPDVPVLPEGSTVGLSHLDLDSLGGLLRLAGYVADKATAPFEWGFWKLAGMVDINGPHRLHQLAERVMKEEDLPCNYPTLWKEFLHAYWAWAENNRLFPPRDGSAMTVTDKVLESAKVLCRIFDGDEELINDGIAFAARENELNKSSFVRTEESRQGCTVVVRHSKEGFTNHLYTDPSGKVCQVVVSLRDDFGSITVSRSGDSVPVNCRDIVQSIWGPEAGGHEGIAGSPRGQKMTQDDLERVVMTLINHLDSQVRECTCGSGITWAMCPERSPYCG